MSNYIPPTLKDLLVKLKIFSKLESGQKINIGNMTFVDSSSWLGAFNRGVSGEGRHSLVLYLDTIVQQAIIAITEYEETEFCALIVNSLAELKIGIQNLRTTYQGDPNVIAQLDLCIISIDLQLNKNKHLLDGHQPTK